MDPISLSLRLSMGLRGTPSRRDPGEEQDRRRRTENEVFCLTLAVVRVSSRPAPEISRARACGLAGVGIYGAVCVRSDRSGFKSFKGLYGRESGSLRGF